MARGTIDQSKPTNDAYTGMLAVSLLALIGGCVLLWLDYSRYPTKAPPPPTRAARSLDIDKAAPGGAKPAP